MSNQSLREMTQCFAGRGRVEAILLRPARLAPMASVLQVVAEPCRGLIGDRRSLALKTGDLAQKREVTLFQAEHLPVIADIPLQWQLGETVILEITGTCEPCSLMESELGPGGYNAMRGHGGVTARVVVGGTLRVHDLVRLRL